MNPFDYIQAWFIWITQYLVQAALDCYNSPLLPDFLGDIFNSLSTLTARISGYFFDLANWYDDVADRIRQILSWSTIWSNILSYVPNLTQIRDWFYSWATNVTSVISSWWSATSVTVHGWINAAVGGLEDIAGAWSNFWNNLWPQLATDFNTVKTAWNNFWTVTFPNLVSNFSLETWWDSRLQDVEDLIHTELVDWFPFYDDLSNLMADIKLFFTNPLTWLIKKLEDWFWEGESE